MEKCKVYTLFSKEEILDNCDEVKKGLDLEYSKNQTISGYLDNIYGRMSERYSDEPYYKLFYDEEIDYNGFNRKKIKVPMILISNDNYTFQQNPMNSMYMELVNMHPCYDGKEDKDRLHSVYKKIFSSSDSCDYVPAFLFYHGFIYSYLDRSYMYNYCSESKKIYLDVGQENFDLLFDDILKLYSDIRTKVDKDKISNMYSTTLNEFKVRSGYANDGIVFRFFIDSHYEIFKEELSKNENILNLLRSSNPFIPVEYVGGHPICVLSDNGGSYNSYIAHACELYISKCIQEGNPSDIKDFLKFLKDSVISMEEIDPKHYMYGCYDSFKNIAIEQVEKQITK